jgi:hypothetical protein
VVILAIELSLEARTHEVEHEYSDLLHRAADPGGLTLFVNFLGAGGSESQLEAIIIASPEYFQTRGNSNNRTFLDAVYADVFNRAIDASGLAAFTQALNARVSRDVLAVVILSSLEARQDFVQSLYQEFLHRTADPAGLAAWLAVLSQPGGEQIILAGIAGSNEAFAALP